jgi:predicted dehydrogenase
LDDDPLRTGIWTHAGAYRACDATVLAAAADLAAERLTAFGAKWGVTALYRDYRDMLARERLDLVSVCTPPSAHAAVVRASAEAGSKAVCCEKPLALSLQEADEAVEVCAHHGTALIVNFPRRWDGVYESAAGLIQAGALGPIRTVVGYADTALFTNAIHMLDLLRYICGEVAWVESEWAPGAVREVDGLPDSGATAIVGFTSGARGMVCAQGADWRRHRFEVDVWGDEGRLRVWDDGRAGGLWRFAESQHNQGYYELPPDPAPLPRWKPRERMVAMIEEAVRAAAKGEPARSTGRDGVASLELVFAIHASAQAGGRRVALPLTDRRWRWTPDGVVL